MRIDDKQAKEELEYMASCSAPDGPTARILRHAIQAIEDRAALVDAAGTFGVVEVANAARRHMRGLEG
jgi:hypothetical protein